MTNIKKLSELLPVEFHKSWKAAKDPNILHIVEKGGRGSGKSTDLAIIIVQLHFPTSYCHSYLHSYDYSQH